MPALEKTRGIKFSMPVSHGLYFPWIPPASVSQDVLLELESQAQQRLRDILDELLVMKLDVEIEARRYCDTS